MSQMSPLEYGPGNFMRMGEFIHKPGVFSLFREPLNDGVMIFALDGGDNGKMSYQQKTMELVGVGHQLEEGIKKGIADRILEGPDIDMARRLERRIRGIFKVVSQASRPGNVRQRNESQIDFAKDVLSEKELMIMRLIARGVLEKPVHQYNFPLHLMRHIDGAFRVRDQVRAKPKDQSHVGEDFWKVLMIFPFEEYPLNRG